ncbi:MAG TPA: CoA transferase [Steroidobacteraceae bacterium]|nr:CoA transferase [Steroidobacteraceae bacterium]
MPLSGIRVVDLSRFLPGPYCSLLLADYGADVIRVEQPHELAKKEAVFGETNLDAQEKERRRAQDMVARNKRSLLLDFRTDAGRETLLSLIDNADVLLHDYRPGVMEGAGLDYASLQNRFPRLVYCAISLCGQDGPYRNLPGHDPIALGLAGALGRFGEGSDSPKIPGVPANDILTGTHAAFGILAALRERDRSGHGQFVDVAMSDSALTMMTPVYQKYISSGQKHEPPLRWKGGNTGLWRTQDGAYICTTDMEPAYWRRFCLLAEREDLVPLGHDPAKREELIDTLGDLFATRTRDEWFKLLREGESQAAPAYSLSEALADPHSRARGTIMEVQHPEFGAIIQIGLPVKLSRTPGRIRHLGHPPKK